MVITVVMVTGLGIIENADMLTFSTCTEFYYIVTHINFVLCCFICKTQILHNYMQFYIIVMIT